MADGKNLNRAKNTGICINAGIQPDSGLTPAFRCKAIISCWRFMAFSLPGYFSLISCISGLITFILALETYDLYTTGDIMILTTMVIKMMISP